MKNFGARCGVRGAVILLLCLLPGTRHPAPILAAGVGTTAADSLNLGMGPRAAGMGEAFTGLADDASALYWNPAGLARLYAPEASFTYLDQFEDTQQHYLAYAHPNPGKGEAFGLSLSYLRVTPFQGYDNSAGKAETVEASDMVLTAGYARRWDRLGVGLAAKYLRSDLNGVAAQTPSADAGLSWLSRRTVREGRLDLGLAASNLFGKLKYDQTAFPLPRTVRLGAAYSKTLVADDALTVTADLIRSEAADGLEYAAGVEYWLLNLVALRAGFHSGQDIGAGFRAGMGLRFRALEFDYSWAGFGDLGMLHRAAVTFKFGKVHEPVALEVTRLFERADYLHRKGRFMEEVLALDRILDIDPANEEALARMKAAAEKVKQGGKP